MNKLKGKLEGYVVSTMEDSQRTSLLDNLAVSAEQVEVEADQCKQKNGVKEIMEGETLIDFCNSLLAILAHELKITDIKQKPSFWFVAEKISLKDIVKMIYRLGIRQSDSARCQVWVRHALIEGTMASYLTLLEKDSKILKQCYKTSAFVRDINMMESAKNMINAISSIQFNIKIDEISNTTDITGSGSYDDNQVIVSTWRPSKHSANLSFEKRYHRGKESASNIVSIEDSVSNDDEIVSSINDSLENQNKNVSVSLPNDFLKSNDALTVINDEQIVIKKEKCLDVHDEYLIVSEEFNNTLIDYDYDTIGCINMDEIPVNKIKIEPDEDFINSSEHICSDLVDSSYKVTNDNMKDDSHLFKLPLNPENYSAVDFIIDAVDHDLSFDKELLHEVNNSINQNISDTMEPDIDETVDNNSDNKCYNYNMKNNNEEGIQSNNSDVIMDINSDIFGRMSYENYCYNHKVDNVEIDNLNGSSNENEFCETSNNNSSRDFDDYHISQNRFTELKCNDVGIISEVEQTGEIILGNDNGDVVTESSSTANLFNKSNKIQNSLEYDHGNNDFSTSNTVNNHNNHQEINKVSTTGFSSCGSMEYQKNLNCIAEDVSDDANNETNFTETQQIIEPVKPQIPQDILSVHSVLSSENSKSTSSHVSSSQIPTLKISGSLVPSQTSAFEVVKMARNHHVQKNVIDFSQNTNIENEPINGMKIDGITTDSAIHSPRKVAGIIVQNKVDQIINVINQQEKKVENEISKSKIDDLSLSGSGSVKIEEEYRNQEGSFSQSVPVEGATQLVNILNNVSVHGSHEDYYVPGIHDLSGSPCYDDKSTDKNLHIKPLYLSDSIPSVQPCFTPTKEIPIASIDPGESSPGSISASSRFFDKTLFRKTKDGTIGSSDSSRKDFDGGRLLCSDTESDSGSTNDQISGLLADIGITEDFIGIKEDHFSTPNTFMGFSSLEELENAIASCKQLINMSPEKSQRRNDLVTQLVQLRLRLHESKDAVQYVNSDISKNSKKVLGHQFFRQGSMSSTLECDACAATIFPLLQTVYVCKDCGFHCHRRCLTNLDKPCVNNQKVCAGSYEINICPEIGLSAQQYRCADCFQRIPLCDGQFDARLCNYTGHKYCTNCHWNDMTIIPARVIHNWDFSCYKISRQSKHLLMVLCKKPDIKLQSLNPILFNFVDELRDIRTLRQQIIMMKAYIVSCRIATEERILLMLQSRQHFVDNSDVYSFQDLLDIHNNVLLNELSRIHAIFGKHIKFDCLLCHGKGFICEFCNGNEIIFPFDNHVIGCHCKGIFHRSCYSQNNCPKCERNTKRIEGKK